MHEKAVTVLPVSAPTNKPSLLPNIIVSKFRNKSVKHIGTYVLANFLSKGISFLFLPLFSYYISEKGFGALAIINNSILLLNSFILFSVPVTLTAEYFKQDKESYNTLFTSLFGYVSLSTIISATIIASSIGWLTQSFGFKWYYIFLLPGLTFLNFFSELLNNYLRIRNESRTYLLLNVLRVIVEIGLAFLIIFSFHNDYYSRVFSMSITSLLIGGYGYYYFFSKLKLFGRFDFGVIKKEIPFGISIFVMQLGIFLMGSSDKFLIKYFYTDDLTGIYNMAFTLSSVLFVLSASAMSYLTQEIYKTLNDDTVNRRDAMMRKFRDYALLIAAAMIFVFVCGTAAFFFLIKKTYLVGYKAFCLLLIGNFFWSLANFFYPVFWHFRAKRKLITISFFSIFISLPLYYFLIKAYSMMGAAISTVLIYLIISFIAYYQAQIVLRRSIPVTLTN